MDHSSMLILQGGPAPKVSYFGSKARTIFSFATTAFAASVDTVAKKDRGLGVTVKSTICFPYGTLKGSKINERLGQLAAGSLGLMCNLYSITTNQESDHPAVPGHQPPMSANLGAR